MFANARRFVVRGGGAVRATARGGRESSIDRQDLDRWERRTGGKGQVAWGLTTRVGEQRILQMRKQRGMLKGLNNRVDIY